MNACFLYWVSGTGALGNDDDNGNENENDENAVLSRENYSILFPCQLFSVSFNLVFLSFWKCTLLLRYIACK